MSQSLAAKIREMMEYVNDPQVISATLGLSQKIIEGFLNGEIPDEVLENYNPAKPPEIKVVEKQRLIRSRSIGVISTNNFEGSILTAYLATNLAKNISHEVAIADFNEFSSQSTILGVNNEENIFHVNFIISDEETFNKKGETHPKISNLSLFMGATSPVRHQHLTPKRIINLLHDINSNYRTVFIDCPSGLNYWETLFKYIDLLIIAVEQNVISLNKYRHIYNYLQTVNVLDCSSIVLISNSPETDLTLPETKKAIRAIGELPILGSLPYDQSVKNPDTLFKSSKYEKEIINILGDMFPEIRKDKRKKGVLEKLASSFNL